MVTGQDIYSLARCLERYPDVYMAFRERLLKKSLEANDKDGFASRRERTRAQRISRYRK